MILLTNLFDDFDLDIQKMSNHEYEDINPHVTPATTVISPAVPVVTVLILTVMVTYEWAS